MLQYMATWLIRNVITGATAKGN